MAVSDDKTPLTEPINKLIDAVSGAIGKVYEPRYVRKMADAKAYEIKTISEEVRNNSDIPIVYTNTGVEINISDYEELVKRASHRLAYQEIAKQENIEAVVNYAYQELEGKNSINEETVSRDWMIRLMNSAEDISNEDMQKFWGKILAGEIMEPNTFSYKTLDCVRNLSKKDAELFERICKIVINHNFIINDLEILNHQGFTYEDILSMDECGLINSSAVINMSKKLSKENSIIIDFGDYILTGNAKEESRREISVQQFPLTKAGREISTIIEIENTFDYIKEVSDKIKNQNKHYKISLYKVTKRNDDKIEAEDDDILNKTE